MGDPRSWIMTMALLCVGACTVGENADGADGADADTTLTTATTGVLLVPTRDVAKAQVVGVSDAVNLYRNVDDGVAFSSADDIQTYVRGTAGVANASHTVGFSGGP